MLINIANTKNEAWVKSQRDQANYDFKSVIDLELPPEDPLALGSEEAYAAYAAGVLSRVRRAAPVVGMDAAMRRPHSDAACLVDLPNGVGYHVTAALVSAGYNVVAPCFSGRPTDKERKFKRFVPLVVQKTVR